MDQEGSNPLTTSEYQSDPEEYINITSEPEEIEDLAESLAFLLHLELPTPPTALMTMSNQSQAPLPVTVAATVRPAEL